MRQNGPAPVLTNPIDRRLRAVKPIDLLFQPPGDADADKMHFLRGQFEGQLDTGQDQHDGFQFEAADASFELMVLRTLKRYQPHFTLGMYRISGEYPFPDGDQSASAMIPP